MKILTLTTIRKLRLWVAAFTLLVFHGANTATADNPLAEVIVTGTRLEQRLAEFSGSVSLLNQKELVSTSHIHIQESLNRLPGVNLQRNNGQEYLPAVRSPVLAGPGACGSFLLMENGVPLKPSGFCNVNELFEAHTEQAERIEVLRGPGTAFHGSNGLHGVINIINPAQFREHKQLRLEGGPNDFARVGFAASGDSLAVSFTGTHDGGYRDNSGYDQQKLSLAHRFGGAGYRVQTDFTAINLNQETAGFIEGNNAYRDRQLVKTNPNPEAYRDAWAMRLSSRWQFNSGLVLLPYARYSDMEFSQHFLPGAPVEENGQTSVGLLSSYSLEVSDSSKLITGVDLEYADTWLKQSQEGVTEGSAFLQETVPPGKHYDYQVDALVGAAFTHWEWRPFEPWTLTLGLRYEWVHYDYDNRMLAGRTRDDGTACGFDGCRYSRPADKTESFGNWSPKLSLMYHFNDSARLWFNVSSGFRAPQMTELYRLQRDQLVADMDSEKLTSVEVGLRGAISGFSYEIVAYRMEKENLIFRDTLFFNVSDGESRHKGVELSASYDITKTIQLGVSASWARHYYTNNPNLSVDDIIDNDIDSAPRHFHNARISYQPDDDLRLELEWIQMGCYYTDPENRHSYNGHDLLNLRGHVRVAPQVILFARLMNLADTDYAERADFTEFGGDRYMPGERRSLYVGVSLEF